MRQIAQTSPLVPLGAKCEAAIHLLGQCSACLASAEARQSNFEVAPTERPQKRRFQTLLAQNNRSPVWHVLKTTALRGSLPGAKVEPELCDYYPR